VQGVEELTSTSVEGRSIVRASLSWGTDLDVARTTSATGSTGSCRGCQRTSSAPDPQVRRHRLPDHHPRRIRRDAPLELRRFVEDQVKYRLERIPGVAAADIRGG